VPPIVFQQALPVTQELDLEIRKADSTKRGMVPDSAAFSLRSTATAVKPLHPGRLEGSEKSSDKLRSWSNSRNGGSRYSQVGSYKKYSRTPISALAFGL
jgi:hypothetical protein